MSDVRVHEDAPSPFVPYPAGLRLQDRKVVVVGGGCVARRRVEGLLAVGARVTVVAPELHDDLRARAEAGEITWHERRFRPSDLNGAWYVVACASDHEVDELVSVGAEERQIFCVRADAATKATAWTPAVGRRGDLTVAVLADRNPCRSRDVRDRILAGLADGSIDDTPAPRAPHPTGRARA